MKTVSKALCVAAMLVTSTQVVSSGPAKAASAAEDINKDAEQALQALYRTNRIASEIARQSRAVLVFPNIVKAGLIFGGAYGEGELKQGGRVVSYYNS